MVGLEVCNDIIGRPDAEPVVGVVADVRRAFGTNATWFAGHAVHLRPLAEGVPGKPQLDAGSDGKSVK